MLACVLSCAILGLDGAIVHTEVDVTNGLPSFIVVGLPDAGHMSSGSYEVGGGFWSSFSEVVFRIFLPLVLRNSP